MTAKFYKLFDLDERHWLATDGIQYAVGRQTGTTRTGRPKNDYEIFVTSKGKDAARVLLRMIRSITQRHPKRIPVKLTDAIVSRIETELTSPFEDCERLKAATQKKVQLAA